MKKKKSINIKRYEAIEGWANSLSVWCGVAKRDDIDISRENRVLIWMEQDFKKLSKLFPIIRKK